MTIDEKIKELGYIEKIVDTLSCYIVYVNETADQVVEIDYDEDLDNCILHSRSLTPIKDFYGHDIYEHMGLTQQEMLIFLEKMNKLRISLAK